VTLELEEGERIVLKEGDTVVQRGTMHTWRNETNEWAKVFFVMLGMVVLISRRTWD
jgi:quercetin dioxygenase-like cupin family protein